MPGSAITSLSKVRSRVHTQIKGSVALRGGGVRNLGSYNYIKGKTFVSRSKTRTGGTTRSIRWYTGGLPN